MSNEKPGATLGWPSSQVTMSYVLLGVTLTTGSLTLLSVTTQTACVTGQQYHTVTRYYIALSPSPVFGIFRSKKLIQSYKLHIYV